MIVIWAKTWKSFEQLPSVDCRIEDHEYAWVDGDGCNAEHGREDSLHGGYDQASVHHELAQRGRPFVRVPAVDLK